MAELATRRAKTENIRQLISSPAMQMQIKMAAPKHLTADRITRIFMTSIQRTPKLADCTPQSLLGAMLTCTQLGLEPDSASQMAHLIPYKTTCTLIVGYKGLMALARRSGDISSLDARAVYVNDDFVYEFGTSPKLKHIPDLGSADRAPTDIIAVYAVAIMKDGGTQFDIMTRADVDVIMKRSQARADGPWITDWAEMARKTVMRRLCKYLPSSPELSQAVTLDEQAERGMNQNIDFLDVDVIALESTDSAEPKNPKTLEDLTPKDAKPPRQVANDQVETLKAVQAAREKITKLFSNIPAEKQKNFLENCNLASIDEVGSITKVEDLQSLHDALLSA